MRRKQTKDAWHYIWWYLVKCDLFLFVDREDIWFVFCFVIGSFFWFFDLWDMGDDNFYCFVIAAFILDMWEWYGNDCIQILILWTYFNETKVANIYEHAAGPYMDKRRTKYCQSLCPMVIRKRCKFCWYSNI